VALAQLCSRATVAVRGCSAGLRTRLKLTMQNQGLAHLNLTT